MACLAQLRGHLASFAGATVLVTHDPLDALMLADRLIIVEDGRIVQTGDAATITMYVQARHVFEPDDPASWYTVGGYYDDTLVRVDSRWLLTGVRLTVTWRAGDAAIMELARAAGNRVLGTDR